MINIVNDTGLSSTGFSLTPPLSNPTGSQVSSSPLVDITSHQLTPGSLLGVNIF